MSWKRNSLCPNLSRTHGNLLEVSQDCLRVCTFFLKSFSPCVMLAQELQFQCTPSSPCFVAKLDQSAQCCALCAKERTTILKQSRSNPQLFINSDNEMCDACKHRPPFQTSMHVKQTTPDTDEPINDKWASPTDEVATNATGAMFAQLVFSWKHCEDQQKRDFSLFISKAFVLETIPTIQVCYKSVTLCWSLAAWIGHSLWVGRTWDSRNK